MLVLLFIGYWYYSCIREFFTFQKESFRKNLTPNHDWYLMIRLEMKMQYDINREALSSGKIDQC